MRRAEWETIGWAAARVGVSRQAVWKRVARLDLPTWEVSPKHVLVRTSDIDAWVNQRDERVASRGAA